MSFLRKSPPKSNQQPEQLLSVDIVTFKGKDAVPEKAIADAEAQFRHWSRTWNIQPEQIVSINATAVLGSFSYNLTWNHVITVIFYRGSQLNNPIDGK
jgi:hypothetical protein